MWQLVRNEPVRQLTRLSEAENGENRQRTAGGEQEERLDETPQAAAKITIDANFDCLLRNAKIAQNAISVHIARKDRDGED